jgi:protein-S-isoprenylcysteine O-methyltransferase Ste14
MLDERPAWALTVPASAMPSPLLVVLQVALMAALAWPWGAATFHRAGLPLLAVGFAVGAWTLTANRPGNFSVFPEPLARARLVTHGPYRYVRHPMYLAVLVLALGCVAGWRTWPHAVAFAALALVLHVKTGVEERALIARFPDYAAYAARTRRIVPFLL